MNIDSKLSTPGLSPSEIADILERHLGPEAGDAEYTEVCTALHRIRRDAANVYLRYALRPLEDDADVRVALRKVLATLRTWHHLSGA